MTVSQMRHLVHIKNKKSDTAKVMPYRFSCEVKSRKSNPKMETGRKRNPVFRIVQD